MLEEIVPTAVINIPMRVIEPNSRNDIVKETDPIQGSENQSKSTKKLRVLIVEDELLVGESVKEILEQDGYNVVGIFSSGEEAVREFAALEPDLMIMDIRLSGAIDGIQTAVVIHYTLKRVPILFLTAYAQDQFPHLASISPPLYSYVTKPYEAKEITSSVQELLDRSKGAEQ